MRFLLLIILVLGFKSYAKCQSPTGEPMAVGDSLILFTTEYKQDYRECVESIRECQSDGTLSGNPKAIYESCLNERTCEHPFFHEPLNDQQKIVAYRSPEAPCEKEVRVCDGSTGILSGSYVHMECKERTALYRPGQHSVLK